MWSLFALHLFYADVPSYQYKEQRARCGLGSRVDNLLYPPMRRRPPPPLLRWKRRRSLPLRRPIRMRPSLAPTALLRTRQRSAWKKPDSPRSAASERRSEPHKGDIRLTQTKCDRPDPEYLPAFFGDDCRAPLTDEYSESRERARLPPRIELRAAFASRRALS